MLRQLLTGLYLVLCCTLANGQMPPICEGAVTPAENCESACINCNLNGYTGSTIGWNADPEPINWCSDIQNDQWIGFVAGDSSATFIITPSNCGGGAGVQAAIYPAGCNSSSVACNTGCATCGSTPSVLSVNNLLPGSYYYLVIDGYGGDICDFTVEVSPLSAVQAPGIGFIPKITGPDSACPGGTFTYSVTDIEGAGFYTWSSSMDGVLFNGLEGPVALNAPTGRTVSVTFPPNSLGNATICVSPSNVCTQGGQECKTVALNNPVPTNLPKVYVCYEDSYTLPWGTEVYVNGTYSHTYQNTYGCDSIVQQQVQMLAPVFTNITRYVCEGSCYTICGVEHCTDGIHSEVCQSYRGCDSTVNLTLKVLAPVAHITAPTTVLSCNTSSILLNSLASPNFPGASIKTWKNLTTGQTQPGSTYTVTEPGTYVLTTSMTAGPDGLTCSQADTIVITATPGSIPVTASGGMLGCGIDTLTLTASAFGMGFSYAWEGPDNFLSTEAAPQIAVPGTYQVTITDNLNCSGTAVVNVTQGDDIPEVYATSDTLTCMALSATISGTSPTQGVTYQWSGPNGYESSNPIQAVTQPGWYTLTVTTSGGCSNTASTLVIGQIANLSLQYTNAYTGCSPTAALVCTSDALLPLYQWNGPENFSSQVEQPVVSIAGTYLVTITDQISQCTGMAAVTVSENHNIPSIVVDQLVNPTDGEVNGSIEISVWDAPGPFLYAWYYNGLAYAGTQDISGLAAGMYSCVVTAANGCTSTLSKELINTTPAIEPIENTSHWAIQPNPGNGYFELISGVNTPKEVVLQLFDALGRLSWHSEGQSISNNTTLNLTHLPEGVYWLCIYGDRMEPALKIMIQH